jgi:hypothetical protein
VPTIPTGALERKLRKLYLQWLAGVPKHEADTDAYLGVFEKKSRALITRMGGQVASLGALAGFPVPKTLELSPRAGVIYDEMKQAAISAGITAGLNSKDVARQMLNAGLDKNYRKLERLARTETVSAYWKNSWDSIADLPLLVMVWGAENGHRTCDYCLSRDGLVVEDGNIRDHPNGRCTPIPTLRSQVKYKGTLQPDGSVTMDPAWADQKVKGAKPKDSAGPTTEAQRDPLSGKSNPAAPSKAQPAQQVAPGGNSTQEAKVNLEDSATRLSTYSTDKNVFAMETSDINIIGARSEIVDRHNEALQELAKAKKKTPEDMRDEITGKMQDFINKGKPVVHVDAESLESILQKGFQTTWDNAKGIGRGDADYLKQRAAAEALNWRGERPIYGMIDGGNSKGMLYGNVKVVLKDSVKDGATVTFGDSINYGANMVATPARDVEYYSLRNDYLHKNNFGRGYNANDLISEYVELQMPSVGVNDIDSVVVMYWEGQPKPELPDSLMQMLKDKGISVTWKVAR